MLNFTNGIVLLLSVVKHQSEFDIKVKFPELKDAIDQIDNEMGYYSGNSKHDVDTARRFNEDARITYHQSVAPVFNWCGEAIDKFNTILHHLRNESMSKEGKDYIWNITVTTINDGLIITSNSLDMLNDVQGKSSRVNNLLKTILHDTYDDFGPNGFYGKRKIEVQKSIEYYEHKIKVFDVLQHIPIVNIVSLTIEIIKEYDEKLNALKFEKWDIQHTFENIIRKIERASQIAKTLVNPYLEEDKTNLVTLRGKADAVDNENPLLRMDSATLRALMVRPIQELITQCHKYNAWHGFKN
ncbi:uncharacterized protein LOC26515414 [Drosophila ananassae]|uniref:uncharacterized protein LOC26515414 n=1 Tax=Drosophila ananassae TaxID=7217 RepID=UPI0013A5E884|nr:uncharacterized protein LOC26515414 [Drosophila ananassae]